MIQATITEIGSQIPNNNPSQTKKAFNKTPSPNEKNKNDLPNRQPLPVDHGLRPPNVQAKSLPLHPRLLQKRPRRPLHHEQIRSLRQNRRAQERRDQEPRRRGRWERRGADSGPGYVDDGRREGDGEADGIYCCHGEGERGEGGDGGDGEDGGVEGYWGVEGEDGDVSGVGLFMFDVGA